jgi:hypothetical protein
MTHGVMQIPVIGVLLLQDFPSFILSFFLLFFFLCLVLCSKNRTGDNLLVRGHDCRLDAATL